MIEINLNSNWSLIKGKMQVTATIDQVFQALFQWHQDWLNKIRCPNTLMGYRILQELLPISTLDSKAWSSQVRCKVVSHWDPSKISYQPRAVRQTTPLKTMKSSHHHRHRLLIRWSSNSLRYHSKKMSMTHKHWHHNITMNEFTKSKNIRK